MSEHLYCPPSTSQSSGSTSSTGTFYRNESIEHVLKPSTRGPPSSAMTPVNDTKPGLRVLCLDGGGVRGLASLLILDSLMNRIAPGAKPCDYFDLICGTSTGGLIAILLARLEYSVADAIKKYLELAPIIFHNVKAEQSYFLEGHPLVKELPMEAAFKALAKGPNGADLHMFNETAKCKCFVTAAWQTNPTSILRIRSYVHRDFADRRAQSWKIWQVARAASAVPIFFKALSMDGQDFIDAAASGCNNPSREAYNELFARDVPGLEGRGIACFVSIGTGSSAPKEAPDVPHGGGGTVTLPALMKLGAARDRARVAIQWLAGVAANPKMVHHELETTMRQTRRLHTYFRFDPDSNIGSILLSDVAAMKRMEPLIAEFLQDGRRQEEMNRCAELLRAPPPSDDLDPPPPASNITGLPIVATPQTTLLTSFSAGLIINDEPQLPPPVFSGDSLLALPSSTPSRAETSVTVRPGHRVQPLAPMPVAISPPSSIRSAPSSSARSAMFESPLSATPPSIHALASFSSPAAQLVDILIKRPAQSLVVFSVCHLLTSPLELVDELDLLFLKGHVSEQFSPHRTRILHVANELAQSVPMVPSLLKQMEEAFIRERLAARHPLVPDQAADATVANFLGLRETLQRTLRQLFEEFEDVYDAPRNIHDLFHRVGARADKRKLQDASAQLAAELTLLEHTRRRTQGVAEAARHLSLGGKWGGVRQASTFPVLLTAYVQTTLLQVQPSMLETAYLVLYKTAKRCLDHGNASGMGAILAALAPFECVRQRFNISTKEREWMLSLNDEAVKKEAQKHVRRGETAAFITRLDSSLRDLQSDLSLLIPSPSRVDWEQCIALHDFISSHLRPPNDFLSRQIYNIAPNEQLRFLRRDLRTSVKVGVGDIRTKVQELDRKLQHWQSSMTTPVFGS